jgi:hypothetical protein
MRKAPLKVSTQKKDNSSGYNMLMKLCKSSKGKNVKEYIDKNGLPDYFYIPQSPFSPMLIYINKNLSVNFIKSGWLIFAKINLDNENNIPLYLYDYFSEQERKYLQNMIIKQKKEKRDLQRSKIN